MPIISVAPAGSLDTNLAHVTVNSHLLIAIGQCICNQTRQPSIYLWISNYRLTHPMCVLDFYVGHSEHISPHNHQNIFVTRWSDQVICSTSLDYEIQHCLLLTRQSASNKCQTSNQVVVARPSFILFVMHLWLAFLNTLYLTYHIQSYVFHSLPSS